MSKNLNIIHLYCWLHQHCSLHCKSGHVAVMMTFFDLTFAQQEMLFMTFSWVISSILDGESLISNFSLKSGLDLLAG